MTTSPVLGNRFKFQNPKIISSLLLGDNFCCVYDLHSNISIACTISNGSLFQPTHVSYMVVIIITIDQLVSVSPCFPIPKRCGISQDFYLNWSCKNPTYFGNEKKMTIVLDKNLSKLKIHFSFLVFFSLKKKDCVDISRFSSYHHQSSFNDNINKQR